MVVDLIGLVSDFLQELQKTNLIPALLASSAVLGSAGLKLYSAVKEPTDSWDSLLKSVAVGLMVAAAIGVMALVGQLI